MKPPFFSNEAFDELADWLVRRRTGITDVVELEGFLTALVIGPNTLSTTLWLPKVWGGRSPKFRDLTEMNRFVALVVGLYNDIAFTFDNAPQSFRPTFYESRVEGRRVVIVDEWCWGFLKSVRLDARGWDPLRRERPDLLRPIELFGSPAGWKECEIAGEEKMHRRWSPKIAPAVRAIHAYWIPHRIVQHREALGEKTH